MNPNSNHLQAILPWVRNWHSKNPKTACFNAPAQLRHSRSVQHSFKEKINPKLISQTLNPARIHLQNPEFYFTPRNLRNCPDTYHVVSNRHKLIGHAHLCTNAKTCLFILKASTNIAELFIDTEALLLFVLAIPHVTNEHRQSSHPRKRHLQTPSDPAILQIQRPTNSQISIELTIR